jgi:serine acetyltransferase
MTVPLGVLEDEVDGGVFGKITIGNNVFIGPGATVKGEITPKTMVL